MCIGLAKDYTSFLLFRLAIGVIGASFVITQFHTSAMFAPKIKGTANAVAGGWGNLGGGVTNMVMPLIFAVIIALGYTKSEAWRYAMVLPGLLLLAMAFVYYRFTKDTPEGNYDDIKRDTRRKTKTNWAVLLDWRIWALSLAYAVCFGMEITFDNIAALHFVDSFNLSQSAAGFWAGIFGFMNLFARALGGIAADRIGRKYGMKGKGLLLAAVLLFEGVGLIFFAWSGNLQLAIISMLSFALFLKMANGSTYAIVPFINKENVGLVSGIVGAGGNVGGMLFGFLFKSSTITYTEAFGYIGVIVMAVSVIVAITRFQKLVPKTETLLVPEFFHRREHEKESAAETVSA
jgi:NNP family nitrate/nitrite transporter-like MFS transporter